jgi:hypothetical protein
VRKYRLRSRRAPQGFAVLYASGQVRQPAPVRSASRTASRARAAARRRLVLTVLLVALGIPVLVGLATGSTAAWWVAVCLLPVVCSYMAVLFRTRRMSAEREINVAFFGGPQRGEFGLDGVLAAGYDGEELRAAAGR